MGLCFPWEAKFHIDYVNSLKFDRDYATENFFKLSCIENERKCF